MPTADGSHANDRVTLAAPPITVPIETPFTRKSIEVIDWLVALATAVAVKITGEPGATTICEPFGGDVMTTF